jgi:hypothetical protein
MGRVQKSQHLPFWRMVSSGMLRHVALVRTDVLEELSASFIRVTSVLTRATRRNIPEDIILHSHHCENLKSYIYYIWPIPNLQKHKFQNTKTDATTLQIHNVILWFPKWLQHIAGMLSQTNSCIKMHLDTFRLAFTYSTDQMRCLIPSSWGNSVCLWYTVGRRMSGQ